MSKPIPHTHVFFGNVGGTGKATLAAGLADYFQTRGLKVLCWSGDPLCPGLEEYRGITVKKLHWKLGELSEFTEALEKAAGSAEQVSVIDFGPTAFLDFAG